MSETRTTDYPDDCTARPRHTLTAHDIVNRLAYMATSDAYTPSDGPQDAVDTLDSLIFQARKLLGVNVDAETCPECGAVEGGNAWGTVGDGYDGYCPSCADQREESGVYGE